MSKMINCLSLGEMCEAALDGEPVFIIRAKDNVAVETLIDYERRVLAIDATNKTRIRSAIARFKIWRSDNPTKCKNPD